jgi:hypothetical protein
MKPIVKRRILLVALVAATVVATCSSCGVIRPTRELFTWDHKWYRDPTMPVCEKYVWKKVPTVVGYCSKNGVASNAAACVSQCLVLSIHSEEEADHFTDETGLRTLREHELKHLAGYNHE